MNPLDLLKSRTQRVREENLSLDAEIRRYEAAIDDEKKNCEKKKLLAVKKAALLAVRSGAAEPTVKKKGEKAPPG